MTTGPKARWVMRARRGLINDNLWPDCGAVLAAIAPGIANASETITGASELGNRWRNMIRRVGTPMARAASTNSFSLSDRTWPRISRGEPDPAHDGKGHEHQQQPAEHLAEPGVAQRGHDDDEEEQVWERVHDIGEAHQQVVDPAPVEPGQHPQRRADDEDQGGGHEPDDHRDPGRPDEPAQDVPAQHVAAEQERVNSCTASR